MTGWRKRQVLELAREAGAVFPADGSYHQFERHEDLERFAELVREDATAEANARANASWAMMCEKMVAIEREACAKVCEAEADDGTEGEWDTCCLSLAKKIRARGQA
jgi:uncharacterized protein (UPF0216 family)